MLHTVEFCVIQMDLSRDTPKSLDHRIDSKQELQTKLKLCSVVKWQQRVKNVGILYNYTKELSFLCLGGQVHTKSPLVSTPSPVHATGMTHIRVFFILSWFIYIWLPKVWSIN